MKRILQCAALLAALSASPMVLADLPSGAPAGATGLCNDGTYFTGATKKGACRGHKGVKDWYGAATPSTPATPAAPAKPAAPAAAPASPPAGATGLCNDGTYYTGATKKGACRGHKGVKDWYAPAAPAAPAAPTAAPPPPATAPVAPTAPPAPPKPTAKAAASAEAAAPGGGPGMVWVNTPTKVYHCMGDRWYGKTKQGEYMTEAAAKAQGYRADHGKACQ